MHEEPQAPAAPPRPRPPRVNRAAPRPRPPRVNRAALRLLREPIPEHNLGKKPRVYCWDCNRAAEETPGSTCDDHVVRWCGTCRSAVSNAHDHDDYVGHAETTDRFLEADLTWNWRPFALDDRGLPAFDDDGGLWIWLTIGGVERPGYGHAGGKNGPAAVSEAVSNALKNTGIRFGVGLNQRAQTDLHAVVASPDRNADTGQPGPAAADDAPPAEPPIAHPDWIARVGSLLARKHGAYGEDRPRVLSEILNRQITDVAKLSPDDARDAVRILSGGPDLHPAPAVDAGPEPADPAPATEPAAATPPAEPEPGPPQPSPRRTATGRPTSKPSAHGPGKAPATAAPGPSAAHVRTINSLLNSRGVPVNDIPARMNIISAALDRPVGSLDELSPADAETLIRGLGSGEVPVGPLPADAPPTDTGPDRSVFDGLLAQIMHAITDDDARQIKIEIGKALMAEQITKADGSALSDRLEKRGRQVGLAGGS